MSEILKSPYSLGELCGTAIERRISFEFHLLEGDGFSSMAVAIGPCGELVKVFGKDDSDPLDVLYTAMMPFIKEKAHA